MTDSDTTVRSVFIWVREGTWRAAVDAALSLAPAGASFTLLHVTDDAVPEAAHGAYLGLFGRAGHDPAARLDEVATSSAAGLLAAAARRLGRHCEQRSIHGHAERAVVTVSAHADLLVMTRDGDQSRPGPHSLDRAGRFVVDHASCPVLLVWPGPPPRDTPGGPRKPGKPDSKHHGL